MCGIGGCVVRPGEDPPVERLRSMGAALRHRGPDDEGVAIERNVGLVHRRLAIVDPSERGAQPMRDPGGQWVLSYNGEVFNHLELRAQLPDADFRSGCDTETVLHSLARWGDRAPLRFNGLFAFAALDLRAQRMLLVRDRLGVKPLYLYGDEREIWFASEIKGLLAAGLPRRPNRGLIAEAIGDPYVKVTETPLSGIERVGPGTVVSIDLRTLGRSVNRWYEPADSVDPERQVELRRRSRGELIRLLDEELRASVRRRLMADVPIGTMCSGGVDSSLVTAYAREASPGIVAFNLATPHDRHRDEGPAAALAARALGVELATAELTPATLRQGFVSAVDHFEYPLGTPGSVGIAEVAALARARGVKALLTGEGADELTGGYLRRQHRRAVAAFLPRRARVTRAIEYARRIGPRAAFWTVVRETTRRRPAPRPLLPRNWGQAEREAVLAKAFAAYDRHSEERRGVEAQLLSDLSLTLPHLLNRMDKNAMQASIEARIPFLDRDVVRLFVNLPLEHRIGPRNKGILRDVARLHLPRANALRPKRPGPVFDAGWIEAAASPSFLADGRLRELFELCAAGWSELIARARGPDAVRLWSAEVWARLVLERQSVEQVERELWAGGP